MERRFFVLRHVYKPQDVKLARFRVFATSSPEPDQSPFLRSIDPSAYPRPSHHRVPSVPVESMSWTKSTTSPSEKGRDARQIRHQLKQISPANSYSQIQSPLFSKIPPEIRNQIFTLAVSQHDHVKPRFPSEYWGKYIYEMTGWEYQKRTCTELLRTCRLVYYETNSIPMTSAIHILPKFIPTNHWGFCYDDSKRWINHLTSKNVAEFTHVHCFGNLCVWHPWIRLPQFQPRQVTHTVPSDKWAWEADSPSCLHRGLAKATVVMPVSLQTYTLELHVCPIDTRDKFDTQLAKLPDVYTITLRDGRVLKTSIKEAKTTSYGGFAYIANFVFNEKGTRGRPEGRRKELLKSTKMPIHLNKFEANPTDEDIDPLL
jgi:hypothetical protein